MAQSLAVKYRPDSFESVCDQQSIIAILKRQLELKQYSNCYLFSGPSGCGKTTLARIFANELNEHLGNPIEIDGASNNSVDNVRNIVNEATSRSIDSKYKVFIIDECHMITTAGWNAFLKCIEEPPMYTIFIFCTTDPQKVPLTIQNRVMKFNLSKISTQKIYDRLKYIANSEHFINYEESIDYISKLSDGRMRDAIATLEKCAGYSTDLSIQNVLNVIGNFSYKKLFELTNAIIDNKEDVIIRILTEFNNKGIDLKIFVDQYLDFVLDLGKYCIFKSIEMTKIPQSMLEDIKYATAFENNKRFFGKLTDKILDLKFNIKNDSSIFNTIVIYFLQASRGN